MKNIRKAFIILIISLFLFLNFANFAYADENDIEGTEYSISTTSDTEDLDVDTDGNSVPVSETRKHDLFLREDSVNIDYPVSGNVFVIANKVTIDNTIDGNVFVLANELTVTENAYISTDLFVCATDVTISGIIYDLYSASNNLNITSAGFIIRDLNSTCNTFNFAGEIKRNANVAFDTINIEEGSAIILGDLNYSSSNEVSISEDVVANSINRSDSYSSLGSRNSSVLSIISDLLLSLLYGLIIVLVIVFAMKKYSNRLNIILKSKVLPVIAFGAIGLILVPVISIILCCTGIGIWLAFALIFTYLFAISISGPVLALSLSKLICEKINKTSNAMSILISAVLLLIMWLLALIPYVSTVIAIIKTILGFGIILYSILKSSDNK